MHILGVILLSLVLWWTAFTLLTVRDYRRRARSLRPPPAIPPEEIPPTPRWPSCRDYIDRPTLFFIIPWVILLHVVLLVFIWPCLALHRIYFPQRYTGHDDA